MYINPNSPELKLRVMFGKRAVPIAWISSHISFWETYHLTICLKGLLARRWISSRQFRISGSYCMNYQYSDRDIVFVMRRRDRTLSTSASPDQETRLKCGKTVLPAHLASTPFTRPWQSYQLHDLDTWNHMGTCYGSFVPSRNQCLAIWTWKVKKRNDCIHLFLIESSISVYLFYIITYHTFTILLLWNKKST